MSDADKKQPTISVVPQPYASSPCYQHEFDSVLHEQPFADEWASIRHWRKQQRKRLIERRQTIESNERSCAGTAIVRALEAEPRFVDRSVAFFWPLDGEVDIRPFMRTILSRNLTVALPVITNRNGPLEFWAWNEESQMRPHVVWDIPVPVVRNVTSPSILFIPLLGFDEQGHRLGHGGGYYDRTLADLDPRPLAVGIGYEFGRLRSIYPQAHDMPMDVIVTEKGIDWHNR
jgi:5-formyltetrahydrofolate cyclo-ligase